LRLQLRPLREPDAGQGIHHRGEVDLALAEVVRVVLEVDLADAVRAQPADLLHDVEPGLRRVPDVVVREDGRRLRALHDGHVVAGGDRVLEPQDDAGLRGGGGDLAQDVAHAVLLRLRLQRALAEERQQDDLDAHRACDGDRIRDPALAQGIRLEVVAMEDLEAERGQRQADALGFREVRLLEGGIGERQAVRALADADLDAVEADLLREGDGRGLAFLLEVPVGDADLELHTLAGGVGEEALARPEGRRGRAASENTQGVAPAERHGPSSLSKGAILGQAGAARDQRWRRISDRVWNWSQCARNSAPSITRETQVSASTGYAMGCVSGARSRRTWPSRTRASGAVAKSTSSVRVDQPSTAHTFVLSRSRS